MGATPLRAWEVALDAVFSEEQQGLKFDKLKQPSKEGHLVVADLWTSLHRATARKLKGAIEGRLPELKAGTPVHFAANEIFGEIIDMPHHATAPE